MTKAQYRLICMIFFSVFGFISCSKEKTVEYKQDSFRPQDITFRQKDSSSITLKGIQQLDLATAIEIHAVDTQNTISKLDITATCRTPYGMSSHSNTTTWLNPTHIAILNVLPNDILLNTTDEPVYCDFVFAAQNNLTSTYSTEKNIVINNLNHFSNLPESHLFQKEKFMWEQWHKQDVGIHIPSEMTLKCSEFAQLQKETPETISLEALLPAQKLWEKDLKSIVQKCRALYRTKDKTYLSPLFVLVLPQKRPTIESYYTFTNNDGIIDNIFFIKYKLDNSNSFPIKIYANINNSALHLRSFYEGLGKVQMGRILELPIRWFLQDEMIVSNFDRVPIEIPPHETVQLAAKIFLEKAVNCKNVPGGIAAPYPFRGFNFELNQDVPFYLDTYFEPIPQLPIQARTPNFSSLSPLHYWHLYSPEDLKTNLKTIPDVIGHLQGQPMKSFAPHPCI